MAWIPKRKKSKAIKPMKAPPYDRKREGLGKCKECHIVNGHTARCSRGGS